MQLSSPAPFAMLYHLGNQDPYGHEIRQALRKLDISIRTLHEEDLERSVGSLCGLESSVGSLCGPESPVTPGPLTPSCTDLSGRSPAPDFPFLLMAFFPENLLDQLLHAMKEASIRIPYKAVLTKTNCTYRLRKLMEEVKSEHDTING
ncbi:MAG: DUF3783 domain-containing protein [Lachnospiraceae bacterium]|nr:DUF3783 domain-containing protein [Lachnospiraceae bacterium]